jgi:prevent-host-death family protein
MRLGLREANQHFARTIKAVRAGKEVVLTDRGRPIAVIKPIKDEAGGQAVALRAMAEEGLITLPDRKGPMPAPRWRPVKVKGAPVSRTIIDDREDTA